MLVVTNGGLATIELYDVIFGGSVERDTGAFLLFDILLVRRLRVRAAR